MFGALSSFLDAFFGGQNPDEGEGGDKREEEEEEDEGALRKGL